VLLYMVFGYLSSFNTWLVSIWQCRYISLWHEHQSGSG
jgi:hypothetical protein